MNSCSDVINCSRWGLFVFICRRSNQLDGLNVQSRTGMSSLYVLTTYLHSLALAVILLFTTALCVRSYVDHLYVPQLTTLFLLELSWVNCDSCCCTISVQFPSVLYRKPSFGLVWYSAGFPFTMISVTCSITSGHMFMHKAKVVVFRLMFVLQCKGL